MSNPKSTGNSIAFENVLRMQREHLERRQHSLQQKIDFMKKLEHDYEQCKDELPKTPGLHQFVEAEIK